VVQNLRQVCVYQVAKDSQKPWLWWDYVTDFAIRCPMKENKYTKECADEVIKSLGMFVFPYASLSLKWGVEVSCIEHFCDFQDLITKQ
jgi:hypothetical protein